MKKRLIISVVAVMLLLAVASIAISIPRASTGTASVKETVGMGDPAAAHGATLRYQMRQGSRMLWDMTYQNGETQAQYTKTPDKTGAEQAYYSGVWMSNGLSYTTPTMEDMENRVGLGRACYELSPEATPGEVKRRNVLLQDYCTHYAIDLDIDLPGVEWMPEYGWFSIQGEDQQSVLRAFRDFFKIPLGEDPILMSIGVSISEEGETKPLPAYPLTEHDPAVLALTVTASAHTADRCFFAVSNRHDPKNSDSKRADFSQVPGGYGIYSFSFRDVTAENDAMSYRDRTNGAHVTGIDANSLATVYPLSQEAIVTDMRLDPTQTRLAIVTEETGRYQLSVIDLVTMKAISRCDLARDEAPMSLYYGDDFITLFYEADLCLYTIQGTDTLAPALTVARPDRINSTFHPLTSQASMDFDGERLIVADFFHTTYSADYCLAVYDTSGLLYYGEYSTDLNGDVLNDMTALSIEVAW